MRITLEIDAAVLAAAKEIARTRGQSLGVVMSELARKGLEGDVQAGARNHAAFPVLEVPSDAPALTVQSVQAIIDYEGLPARR
jgi:GTP:adenosylcobinamide-phosphate guanylyltransferase